MKHGDLHIVPFVHKLPIYVGMFGINYCYSSYLNVRNSSTITVLAYVLKGQGNVTIDSLSFRPKAGDVFILPKDCYHKVTADPDQEDYWTYLWFNIRGNVLQLFESFQLQSAFHIPDTPFEGLFRKGFQLVEQYGENHERLQMELLLTCTEIIAQLSGLVENRQTKVSVEVQRMKQYLKRLETEPFHSSSMSRHFAMSFKQINRLFKKETGTTVYNYLLGKKIDTAKMLLQDTSMAVGEIAYRIGYADPHYFSNVFKKKTGSTPTEYREESRVHDQRV
ncbi:AraC family transcriptional regulator [Paenibacillus allorhizosphaerae]|uniref:Arabinose operon regulatory protein n=1 Tax=Paenibacillus allorhizosphaerae TaxID=2849866 RepID=A0ABM8VGQ8_9BACL|nr:AraC family transcriptional regulator [Paenibacillus allorhizosphaerae]CAG7639358.1 Arabinose operon regulatory protein [Paenibacillus allorhizosphaerae]